MVGLSPHGGTSLRFVTNSDPRLECPRCLVGKISNTFCEPHNKSTRATAGAYDQTRSAQIREVGVGNIDWNHGQGQWPKDQHIVAGECKRPMSLLLHGGMTLRSDQRRPESRGSASSKVLCGEISDAFCEPPSDLSTMPGSANDQTRPIQAREDLERSPAPVGRFVAAWSRLRSSLLGIPIPKLSCWKNL